MPKIPKTHGNWKSPIEFIDYLKNTLIPDLKLSSLEETAKDFEDAVFFIQGLYDLTQGITKLLSI